jgi:hypothetical protein
MNIEAKGFELKMTYGELWSLGFDAINALRASLKDHWVNHQLKWKEGEKERIDRIKQIFNALGRQDIYATIESEANDIFDAFNAKKNA